MPEITKQDALRWLEMQRDAINTEIAYAAPSDKAQYHGNLRIVNWIADRLNEMTAVEYLEAHRELCAAHMDDGGIPNCKGCPLDETTPPCGQLEEEDPLRAVETVKRWKEKQDELRH